MALVLVAEMDQHPNVSPTEDISAIDKALR
jgi:hypothetical protein